MQIFGNLTFNSPIEIIEAFDSEGFRTAFSRIENLRKRPNMYLLGYVRYEAKEVFLGNKIKSDFPLLYFEVFEKENVKNKKEKGSHQLINLSTHQLIDYQSYKNCINGIKDEISCGNTYEVNCTYDWKIETKMDGFELYNSILPNQTTLYNSYIKNKYEEILCFSPELFFELKGNKILTKPMKGTVKRGKDSVEDAQNVEFLKNDEKNRAENVMIVDLLRNDLGKIAKTGTVSVDKLFDVETHKTVYQMTSEISAELEDDFTLYEIFDAIFPCGSITGAPKNNTMKIIDDVEVGQRGVYCGAIGLITNEKTVFSVPIRTLQKKNNEDFYLCRVGGAIVWDSTPEDEWEETLTKIKFLQPDFKLVETILVKDGNLKFAQSHFERMKKSAQELGFDFNDKILNIKSEKDGILRVLLSKNGAFETQLLPLSEIKSKRIIVSKAHVNSEEKFLYHKTTFRPWYEASKEKIKSGEIFDEIFLNEKGELTEGSRSNIVLQINGEFFTPHLKCGLLNGVLRQDLFKNSFVYPSPNFSGTHSSCRKIPSPSRGEGEASEGKSFNPIHLASEYSSQKLFLKEKVLYLDDLKNAERIFCINSVRGIVEVYFDNN